MKRKYYLLLKTSPGGYYNDFSYSKYGFEIENDSKEAILNALNKVFKKGSSYKESYKKDYTVDFIDIDEKNKLIEINAQEFVYDTSDDRWDKKGSPPKKWVIYDKKKNKRRFVPLVYKGYEDERVVAVRRPLYSYYYEVSIMPKSEYEIIEIK